jgi:DNA-binding Lrp family transcriptional regulator
MDKLDIQTVVRSTRGNRLESVYVLIRVKPTFEQKVGAHLKTIKEAKEVHPLFGEYDFIVKLEGKTHEDIGRTVLEKIRAFEGVAATKTMIKTKF